MEEAGGSLSIDDSTSKYGDTKIRGHNTYFFLIDSPAQTSRTYGDTIPIFS
jgi:hypothetical protein